MEACGWGQGAAISGAKQVGCPSKATIWRGRHDLNLPHHQQGGTPALWSPSTKGTKESAGGAQGRRRREGAVEEIFHFHWKVKVTLTLSLLLFSWYFCQCLKRARGRKYSTINVSKFLPASNCSKKTCRNQIMSLLVNHHN